MFKLGRHRAYCLITGAILFLLGIIGFAFRTSFDIPEKYLILDLILGFWGVVVAFGEK